MTPSFPQRRSSDLMMRPAIKDPADIESTLGLNVFATVPHTAGQTTLHRLVMERRPGNHVLASTAPSDPAIESLSSLRTALQFGMLGAPHKIILFSAPNPRIGQHLHRCNSPSILCTAGKRQY